jgi:hypothetical protein
MAQEYIVAARNRPASSSAGSLPGIPKSCLELLQVARLLVTPAGWQIKFHTKQHPDDRCVCCGAPVLSALFLDGARFCSQCYEDTFQELGGGG